jgi:subtilisin family serine protease
VLTLTTADAPLWCAFYDTLGAHGILSAGATANLNIDIDANGDLPTACPSEYLLSVTALNHNNERTFSAFGLTQVDFGAPCEDIYTTRRNYGYGTTSGTSFASPVAAGLVALLYSAHARFADLIHSNPSAAALCA